MSTLKEVAYFALALAVVFFMGKHYGYNQAADKFHAENAEAIEQAEKRAADLAQQLEGIKREHSAIEEKHAANVADAKRVNDGLQQELSRLRRSAQAASASGVCTAAQGHIVMLANMLGSANEASRKYARIADERGAAGLACQRAYDAAAQ